MPITAGSMGMKFKHFLGVDLFSGLIWAPLYSLPGYFAGKIVFKNTDSIYLLLGLSVILILVVLIFKKIFHNRT
jgi:membrane protein DedA with SNARE-associated domain